jgi:hypothetical protein
MKDPAIMIESAKAKRLLFTILSCLWVFPSLGACWILLASRPRPLGLEDWVAFALLATHLMFAWLALQNHFRLRRLEARFAKSSPAADNSAVPGL